MKTAAYQPADKNEILDRIFSFLVTKGLENISIRDLCKGTGLVQGSLYYWFVDKETIISEATEHGLKKLTAEIFSYAVNNISDLDAFFGNALDMIDEHRKSLCFVYQMAASPVYGKKMKEHSSVFKMMNDKYIAMLAERVGCSIDEMKPIVHLFISAICGYAIWEDPECIETEIDYIHSALKKIVAKD